MSTDFGDHAYACTYWRHHHRKVDFGADLEQLVRSNYAADERGEQSTEGYWRATDGGWDPADGEAGEVLAKIRAEEDAELSRWAQERGELLWQVHIEGPNGTTSFESRHATREEAEAAAAGYPSLVAATVRHA